MDSDTLDDGLSAFVRARPRLFGIAYRMHGSAVEAEDLVQDIWMKWQAIDRSSVRDATAYLAGLEHLFASDVLSYSDGGGYVRAARSPVAGRTRAARFSSSVAPHFWTGVTRDSDGIDSLAPGWSSEIEASSARDEPLRPIIGRAPFDCAHVARTAVLATNESLFFAPSSWNPPASAHRP
jgi:hypothetical protein